MLERHIDRIEVQLGQALRRDATRCGLREATARVLLALEADDALPMQRIAERLGRDPSTATRFVDRAEAEGLVLRVAGDSDRRKRWVRLTPSGLQQRQALLEVRAQRLRNVEAALEQATGLGASQVEWFVQALTQAVST
ncbi:MAG: MarR family winged helix-turn-helix transcriptional regulator [Planctomycetia bacterium]